MKLKKIIGFIMIFVLIFGVQSVQDAKAKPLNLKMATVDAIGTLRNKMGNLLVEEVAGMNNDGLTITHIEGPVLGNAGQVMDQVAEGSIAIEGTDLAWIVPFDKDLQPTSFGFVFRDLEHFKKYLESDIFNIIVERIAGKKGLRIIAATPFTTRMFFSRKPIDTLSDMQGLKVRAPGLEMFVESYKAYGCNPTPISWNETYLALKTGVVDAAQGLPIDVLANKWHLAAPYITKTNDMYAAHAWVINESIWQSLSKLQQEVLLAALKKVDEWALNQALQNEQSIIDTMVSEGAKYNGNFKDFEVLREKALSAAKNLESAGKWSSGLISQINSIQ